MNKIFIYNDVLRKEIQETLKIEPIKEQFAVVEGKLFMFNRIPLLFNLNDITRNRSTRTVFGSILTFKEEDMKFVINALDMYHGCSISRLGISNPNDITYRSSIIAYPILFDNIQDLENSIYTQKQGKVCLTYMGNTQNNDILYTVKFNKYNKIYDGVYVKGFKDLLKRKGVLND